MLARLLILGAGVVVSGCFGGRSLDCADAERYGYSTTVPPMRVPEGLSVPDERDALQIPPGETYVVPDPETMTECLENPPDFFDGEDEDED